MKNMPKSFENGYEKGTCLDNGVVDGGENPYLFPEVQVVEVKEINGANGDSQYETNSQESDESGSNDISTDLNEKPRAAWGGQMEFILTMVGYAVGLGNVWRFPYLCYKNGGGAFLLPYTLMLAAVGLPLFYMEVGIGQFASLGPLSMWRMNPLLKGLGYAMVIVSWLIGLYYNVVISHVLYFLYASFTTELPWASCGNDWNTINCRDANAKTVANNTFSNTTTGVPAAMSLHTNTTRTPSEEFYRYHVLQQTDSIDDFGTIQWHLALTLFIAWVVVFLVLLKGIKTLGKVVYFTATFPYVMLTVLFIRGVTLPGASVGIEYYLKPNFERLLDPHVWSDAATQIFYSLSACTGGLIAMSSYNKFNNNCFRDSLIVCFVNCGTSVFAGLVIFSVLGFMATEKGVDVSKVADGGPGLAFVVYPEALSRMPIAPMWSVFFFIMMATLGFGSEFSYVETFLCAIGDEFPQFLRIRKNNIIFRAVMLGSAFLLGLPMVCNGGIYLLNIVDFSVGGFPLLVVGLLELVGISWIYGMDKYSENVQMMIGSRPGKYWIICWKFLSPFIIALTIILNIAMYKEPTMDDKKYPAWANSLAWLISMFPIVAIPAWFLYKYCTVGGFEVLRENMKPLPSFGPVKEKRYAEMEAEIKNHFNPAFTRLMGSQMSNTTSSTEFSPQSSTLNLIKSRSSGESNV